MRMGKAGAGVWKGRPREGGAQGGLDGGVGRSRGNVIELWVKDEYKGVSTDIENMFAIMV